MSQGTQYQSQDRPAFGIGMGWMTYQKIMHWVGSTTDECSGLGKVVIRDGRIVITDAILLPQKNAGSSTDIEAEDVAKAMFALKDQPGDLRFWWHSHANMGVFWSQTDVDTMKMLGGNGWFVCSVFNRRAESKTALFMAKPFTLFQDDLRLAVSQPALSEDTIKEWDAEFKKNVKPRVVETYSHHSTRWEEEWDVESGRYVKIRMNLDEFNRLSRKEKKTVIRLRKKFTAGTYGRRDEGCPICGWHAMCDCPKELRKFAEDAQSKGFCWECDKAVKDCECDAVEQKTPPSPSQLALMPPPMTNSGSGATNPIRPIGPAALDKHGDDLTQEEAERLWDVYNSRVME